MPAWRTSTRALLATALLAPVAWSAAPSSAASSTMALGTYNIRAGVSTGTFRSAVTALIGRVQVAGLQEVNSHAKESVLGSLSGWSYFRSPYQHGEQTPVIWNTGVFKFLSARSPRLSKATYVGHELPGRNGHLPPYYATVVRLMYLPTGQRISIVNVHLVPGAIQGGVPIRGRAKVLRLYLLEVAHLAEVTKAERTLGPVYVLGDFNVGWKADMKHHHPGWPYRTFKALGMRSMWATERPAKRGTHSTSLIDQVFARAAASTATVAFAIKYSDHFPAIAHYVMPGS
ncbi:MAG: endonuclease/exonuclease/phosphatase family protein [Nocardioidaceae bacterium]